MGSDVYKSSEKKNIITMRIDNLDVDLCEFDDGITWTLYIRDSRVSEQIICQDINRKNVVVIVDDLTKYRNDVFIANAIEGKYLK